ncbi:hypothetical protein BOW65_09510 [Pseudomonas koreensis]|uniref:hypothetical protein n=1 Tax=Pseudomonas koreensis TaxID=198620 RepID=UPI0009875983|nr:hypothetical protein [Pseudomonas koreensis]OOH81308.1 hypothetical protein BOW65_09510 [Pseudomonas koreensis]
MTSIKERPILFSAPMVRAILDGRKTVTRRPVKGAALKWLEEFVPEFVAHTANGICPFGQIGDRLWVRESFWHAGSYVQTYPEDDVGSWSGTGRVHYRADGAPPNEPNHDYPNGLRNGAYSAAEPAKIWRARPSIHMPRWASRILLEITDVRVERLQDITYEQAAAEGVHRGPLREWCASDEGGACHKYPVPAFRDLWQSTGGDWDANPWVWCVSFRRLTP